MRVFKTAGLVQVFLSVTRASEEYDTEFNPNDYIGYPNDPQVSYGNAVSSLLPGPYPEDPPLSETIDRVAQFDMNELGQFVDQVRQTMGENEVAGLYQIEAALGSAYLDDQLMPIRSLPYPEEYINDAIDADSETEYDTLAPTLFDYSSGVDWDPIVASTSLSKGQQIEYQQRESTKLEPTSHHHRQSELPDP
ncbi:hypothetical protein H4R33_004369, partial [Dimargaris cristalligena]